MFGSTVATYTNNTSDRSPAFLSIKCCLLKMSFLVEVYLTSAHLAMLSSSIAKADDADGDWHWFFTTAKLQRFLCSRQL